MIRELAMRMAVAVFAVMLGDVVGACAATPAVLTPPTGPGTEYPCGVSGVVCAAQHSCCDEGETCGGESGSVGCPAGYCCDVQGGGPESYSKRPWRKQRALP